jgi:hypothetical protein
MNETPITASQTSTLGASAANRAMRSLPRSVTAALTAVLIAALLEVVVEALSVLARPAALRPARRASGTPTNRQTVKAGITTMVIQFGIWPS